jgi:hypothetical protein
MEADIPRVQSALYLSISAILLCSEIKGTPQNIEKLKLHDMKVFVDLF